MITSSTTTTGSPGREGEAAAQGHHAVLPLGEEPPAAEGPRHLVGHEDAAEGRGHDRPRLRPAQERPQPGRQVRAETGGERRVHEDAGALEVARRVEARGEQEVALEQGAALLEDAKQVFGRHCRAHGATIIMPARILHAGPPRVSPLYCSP